MTGIFYGGNGKQLGWQLIGFVTYFSWAFGTCSIMFFTLNRLGWFRVSEEVERMGMDIHHHGGSAYRFGSMFEDQTMSLAAQKVKCEMEETSNLDDDVEKGSSGEQAAAIDIHPEGRRVSNIGKQLSTRSGSVMFRRGSSSSYALTPGAF